VKKQRNRKQAALAKKRRAGRLPRLVSVGRGYRVKVVLVSQLVMQEVADDDEIGVTAGCWIMEEMTIYVDATCSRRQQWETYFHELQHAAHDIAEDNRGGI